MIKTILLSCTVVLGICAFSGKLNAQIILTQANMPAIGTKAVIATDSVPTVTPGNAGPSQTWNYSALKNQKMSSVVFVNPGATPYFALFPTATLADSTVGVGNDIYFIVNSTVFEGVGTVQTLQGYTAEVAVNPPFVQLPLPATYGTIDGGTTAGGTKIAISYLIFDSGRVSVHVNYADTVDAYGVMTTPYAPGGDTVFRQKHYEKDIDSIWVHSTFTGWAFYQVMTTYNNEYRFYTDAVQYTFVQLNMDSANSTVKSVQWFNGVNAGINEISNSRTTQVYPNPCSSQITFKCSSADAKTISVFDITGRQLSTNEIRNNVLNLNILAYSTGVYLYRVYDITGNILDRGKFLIQ